MNKIVLLIDAMKYVAGSTRFAADIARLSGSSITGLFIYDTNSIAVSPELKMLAGQVYVEEIALTPEQQMSNQQCIDRNIALFKEECAQLNVQGTAELEKGLPLDLVIQKSRFADLIIIPPFLTFTGEKNVPTEFVTDVLTKAECPILLAPEIYDMTKEVVLAYDGSRSAVYAIKQFFYLFPSYRGKKVKVLSVTEDGGHSEDLKNEDLFRDWMSVHCPSYSFVRLTGNAKDVLFNYFMEIDNNDKMLVTGAFGRNAISRFFKPGTADLVLKTADIPAFVAHY